MEDIMKMVSKKTFVSEDMIISKRRHRKISEARQIFMYIASSCFGYSQKDIALFLHRKQAGVSYQLTTFEQQLKIYKGLKKKVDEIKQSII